MKIQDLFEELAKQHGLLVPWQWILASVKEALEMPIQLGFTARCETGLTKISVSQAASQVVVIWETVEGEVKKFAFQQEGEEITCGVEQ